MKRTEAIKFHTEEAAACDRLAAMAPGPGSRECAALASDHRAMAEAARAGEYDTDLDD